MRGLPILVLCSLGACGKTKAPSNYQVTFRGTDSQGRPLEGVYVKAGETPIGLTGAEGVLDVTLSAFPGATFSLTSKCPEGYKLSAAPEELRFRVVRSLEGQNTPISVSLKCRRDHFRTAVLVDTSGYAGLPIFIDGLERTRTSEMGFAHLVFEASTEENRDISVDTTLFPELEASKERKRVSIGRRDALELATFAIKRKVKTRRVRRRRSRKKGPPQPPPSRRPVRID